MQNSLDPLTYRGDFPILGREVRAGVPLIYFDNAASTQHPHEVIQSIVSCYEEHYANVHRGIHQLAQESDELFDEARESVRAFINAPERELCIFTYGATSGINTVARSGATRTSSRATRSCSPRWSITPISSPGSSLPSAAGPCCGTSRSATTACSAWTRSTSC